MKSFMRTVYAFLLLFAMTAIAAGHDRPKVEHHGPAYPGEKYGVQQLVENVYAYIGEGGGSNSGFIVTAEGVIVIDARDNADLANAMLADIRKITPAPIKYLISTHHHGDHVGGNTALQDKNTITISHKECRALMEANQAAGLPNVTFDSAVHIFAGGRELRVYHYGWGHTKGDAVIYLPDVGVLFAGDLLFIKKFPFTRDGHLAGWQSGLEKIKTLNARMIVPGHGAVCSNAEVNDLAAFFQDVQKQVGDLKKQGKTAEQVKTMVNFEKYKTAGWGGGFFDQLPPMIAEWMFKQ